MTARGGGLTAVAPELTDGKVWLTRPRIDDYVAFREGQVDPLIHQGWVDAGTTTAEQFAELVAREESRPASDTYRRFAVRRSADGPLVGWLAIKRWNWEPDTPSLDIWLNEGSRRIGLARRAVTVALDFLFGQGIGGVAVEIRKDNEASVELALSLGFWASGELKGFPDRHDVMMVVYRLTKDDWTRTATT